MKSILITGVPGSGKSTIAEALAAKGYATADLDTMFCERLHAETREPVGHHEHNLEKIKNALWHCDVQKLRSHMRESHEPTFYFGYSTNLDEILELFDSVVLLTVPDEHIRERLKTRENNDFGQTEDVQNWVISWKHEWEETMRQKSHLVVSTEESVVIALKKVLSTLD